MSEDEKQGQVAAGSPHLVARRGRRGPCGTARRIRCTGLSIPRRGARDRLLGIPDLQDRFRCAAAHRRAAKTEIVVECRRGLPRAGAGRHRPWHSSRSTISTSNWSITAARPTSCWRRSRPARRTRALGMALRWLKPLEQGFDVKIAAGTHGGCMRVLSRTNSGIDKLADLKGKIVGSAISAVPTRTSSRSSSHKQGIDPNKDVDWRAYPGNLLQLAVEKGEVQAFLAVRPDRLYLAEGQRLQGSRVQSRRRIQGQDLLHSSACAAAWFARSRRWRAA